MLKTLGLLLLIVIFVIGILIGYYNASPVLFDYLAGTVKIRLVVLLLIDFSVGVLLAILLCSGRLLSQRSQIRRLRRQLKESDTELKNLRSLPLRDQ